MKSYLLSVLTVISLYQLSCRKIRKKYQNHFASQILSLSATVPNPVQLWEVKNEENCYLTTLGVSYLLAFIHVCFIFLASESKHPLRIPAIRATGSLQVSSRTTPSSPIGFWDRWKPSAKHFWILGWDREFTTPTFVNLQESFWEIALIILLGV